MLMNRLNESITDTLRDTKDPRRHRRKREDDFDNSRTRKHARRPSDYGQNPEFSSISASDDVEMNQLSSDEGLTDEEETGLTKKDLSKSKRRRRKHTQLGERVAEVPGITHQEQSSANKNVIRALIMNALLIASWYAFSLSISIVSFAFMCVHER